MRLYWQLCYSFHMATACNGGSSLACWSLLGGGHCCLYFPGWQLARGALTCHRNLTHSPEASIHNPSQTPLRLREPEKWTRGHVSERKSRRLRLDKGLRLY